ncbi:hypothetical protein ABZW10_32990 [Kitasatospora sp. NPDC004723]|uniref:hypothetical protein n=1 Tax=Kitasatospora sp. NPDC004723 TaxID=3154288 RepID=UPI0033B40B93
MAEITYAQVQAALAKLVAETGAEVTAAAQRRSRLAAKATEASVVYDRTTDLKFDVLTLSDVGTVRDRLAGQAVSAVAAANAANDLNATARSAAKAIEQRHGGINSAVASATVPAAHESAYNNRL